MSQLEWIEIDDDGVWDAGVEASLQGTVFCRSAHLRALGLPFRRYAVREGGKTVALLPAVEAGAGRRLVQPPFSPYQGLLFLSDRDTLPRQRLLSEFRIAEFVVTGLTARYDTIALALSWHLQDLRPFLWHNHHLPGQPRFKATPRYTALLALQDTNEATLTAQVRACRRQELRKAGAARVSDTPDIEQFLALYAQTFDRQDIAVSADTLAQVRRITEAALVQGYGRLSACTTTQGVASMSLFVYDQRRAYYLFGANDPAQRNSGAATRLMLDNLFEARRRGLAEVDFVGVNSPNRGDFKLSFNPVLAPYFEISLEPV